MSSRHQVSRHERSRSRSPERRSDRKARSRDRSPSRNTSKQKHKSHSRERKSKERKETSKHKKRSKKKKKKRDSSSSSSSDSGEEELKLLQRLEAERLRLKEERQKQKELEKANETPEQKRARRLKEKQEKEHRRRERMGWDNEYQCYTNQDNPFGDSALTNTFVWTKKLAKEGVKTVTRDELEASNRQKQMENKIELEKVKQRRVEREAERAAREAESSAAARARAAAQFSSWARHEGEFHLQQARLRSQIRIRDGRAKPIDLLAWYVSSEQCVDALEMHEPYTYLNGLQLPDLEDLLEDIKVYKELENNANQSYWEDVQTIVQDELNKLRRVSETTPAPRDHVHQAVADDVTQIFKGKTGAQLEALQKQIEAKISGRRDGVDVGYWESLLSQLRAHMSRARLRDRHQLNLRRKLQLLKQEQGVQGERGGETQGERGGETQGERGEHAHPPPSGERRPSTPPAEEESKSSHSESSPEPVDCEQACIALYNSGRYSPTLLSPTRVEADVVVTSEEAVEERRHFLRTRPQGQAPVQSTSAFEREAALAMGPATDAAQFSVEQPLAAAACVWADKYRARKPRYFNRVHTGFEWNKYNQTHYDMDNPPPKIVQGYKFNIFYPDLIDNNSTPEFSLKPCPDNPDFAVLRFHAGPPYEDIAFKIVNREWEYSYKRGFRCHFHNNIFQLWFHFKRYRYRR